MVQPSIQEINPEFSIKNIFKPTPKKQVVLGMMIKIICIGLVALGSTLLAMVSIVADLSHTLLACGIALNIVGLVGGAIGESIILFTKEEPISSLFRAAEEIKINPTTVTIESQPITNAQDEPSIPNN